MLRMFLLYSVFVGRLRELRVVCGIVLAVCCTLIMACWRVGVLSIICIVRFLNMIDQAMVLGIQPFVDGVVECCLVVLMVSSSSSMCKITG